MYSGFNSLGASHVAMFFQHIREDNQQKTRIFFCVRIMFRDHIQHRLEVGRL
jgi:hypothetical protein